MFRRRPIGEFEGDMVHLSTSPRTTLRPWRHDARYEPRVWESDMVGNLRGPGAPPGFFQG